jgi:hypothetical protein
MDDDFMLVVVVVVIVIVGGVCGVVVGHDGVRTDGTVQYVRSFSLLLSAQAKTAHKPEINRALNLVTTLLYPDLFCFTIFLGFRILSLSFSFSFRTI